MTRMWLSSILCMIGMINMSHESTRLLGFVLVLVALHQATKG